MDTAPTLPADRSTIPPAGSDQFAALETALTRLIRRAFLPTHGEASRREAGVSLERAAYATLVRTCELDGGRLSDIAAVLGLDVSTTSRHLKRLVEMDLVAARVDPDDARARRFSATSDGLEMLRRVGDARRAHLARVLDDWDPETVTTLADGLDRLIAALDADQRA